MADLQRESYYYSSNENRYPQTFQLMREGTIQNSKIGNVEQVNTQFVPKII